MGLLRLAYFLIEIPVITYLKQWLLVVSADIFCIRKIKIEETLTWQATNQIYEVSLWCLQIMRYRYVLTSYVYKRLLCNGDFYNAEYRAIGETKWTFHFIKQRITNFRGTDSTFNLDTKRRGCVKVRWAPALSGSFSMVYWLNNWGQNSMDPWDGSTGGATLGLAWVGRGKYHGWIYLWELYMLIMIVISIVLLR